MTELDPLAPLDARVRVSVPLAATGISVALSGRTVLDQVSLELRAGEVLGLIGPNGAGKSTLVAVLAGLRRPDHGRVELDGDPLSVLRPQQIAVRVGYVPQDTGMDFEFTARQVVLMGLHPHLRRFAPVRAEDELIASTALSTVGGDAWAEQPVTTLSGGQRQLVHLAKALAGQPRVLLLDEPVAALDLRHQLHVLGLLRAQAGTGVAVLVVLHDLDQAARFCDRIALLHAGRLLATGTPEDVLTPDTIATAYGIRAVVRRDPDLGSLRVVAVDLDEQTTRGSG